MRKRRTHKRGFALPTVLIASVVMLTVLSVAVSSVAAIRTTLKVQYYEQLAKAAGEAGTAYAKACLAKNSNVPLWTDDKPLTPSTDCAGNQMLDPSVEVLVVAGGGGGGNGIGGGGGGGGVVQQSVAVGVGGYAITVGGGGSGATTTAAGANGGVSRFGSLLSTIGGGGGATRIDATTFSAAGNGGSGGGGNGTYTSSTGTGTNGGSGTAGQGNNGGQGSAGATSPFAGNGGGGGGAGGRGGNASGTAAGAGVSGNGGQGQFSDISGGQLFYGAGGSGGRWDVGAVGTPGITGGGSGASGSAVAGSAGLANTGAGGGGGSSGSGNGGNGGSGVVIIRYPKNGSITASGGSAYDSGTYRVHRFTSSGTFTISAISNSSCPSDPRCSVVANDQLRSSFKVPRPTVSADGRAIAIPNTGYVELLRASNGAVWRTYRQPAQQSAVVPDLCSGAAGSTLGWSNAVASSNQASLNDISTARTITLADTNLYAGAVYYRKDFTITKAGAHDVIVSTGSSAADFAEVYIDGVLRAKSRVGGAEVAAVTLDEGCHVATIRVTNKTVNPRRSQVTMAVQNKDTSEIVTATDTSWRVAAGSVRHFSQTDYFEFRSPDSYEWQDDSNALWAPVIDGNYPVASLMNGNWESLSKDAFTRMVSPVGNGCPNACPAGSTTFLRDSKYINLNASEEVLVSSLCDDNCTVFIDGQAVIPNSPSGAISQQTMTLTEGQHQVGIRLYNGGSSANPASAAVTIVRKSDNTVLTRTDRSWRALTVWNSGSGGDVYSYEASFRPSPSEIADPVVAQALVVGGGGGGGSNAAGGGGGGGVTYRNAWPLRVGAYQVRVGAGGIGRTYTGTGEVAGGTSYIIKTGDPQPELLVQPGGTGASRDGGQNPGSGRGSGGGGSGQWSTAPLTRYIGGAAGADEFASAGGNGMPSDAGGVAKGGGGGGATGSGMNSTTAVAGNGGSGIISYITGSVTSYAGGGGGGNTAANGAVGSATDGGASGTMGVTPAAEAGRGGGGGASSSAGAGGAGGSGVVIIRIKVGTASVTASGYANLLNITVDGTPYQVYIFTGNGSFTVNSLTPQ